MSHEMLAYIYSFSAVVTFSAAAIGFTYFSQKVSPLWMNIFKCLIAFVFCSVSMLIMGLSPWQPFAKIWPFLLSGFIGLNIGDLFLLSAYKRIGPARTLILAGFTPFIAGSFAYFLWDEKIYPMRFVAILFFVLCLVLFSYEQFRKTRSWEFRGLSYALIGVILDSAGVILTRQGYLFNPDFGGVEALYYRALAALLSFAIFIPFVKIRFIYHLKKLSIKESGIAVVSSFFGTFLSLVFYMQAIRFGKIATVTSIVLTDPMMSTFFECLWLRVWPTKYLWWAILAFLCAMFFLLYPQGA
jgi:drug/metabolite transporter (DMT)-like permease